MKLTLPCLAAVTLAACASVQPDFAGGRTSWHGATLEEVIAAWGPPARSAKDSHDWLSRRGGGGAGAGGMIFDASGAPARCDRTLLFREGRVVVESWSGDPAFCATFVRKR